MSRDTTSPTRPADEATDSEQRPARVISQRTLCEGSFLSLDAEEVELPNGNRTTLELLRHPGAAAVVALTEAHQVLLVRQYRHATGGFILEVPAGKLDGDEAPESCARRELEEEVGYRAGELVEQGWIWTSPGFTDEKIHLYLARQLSESEQALQDDEVLGVERMALERAVQLAAGSELSDAKSVAALWRAARWLEEERASKMAG